MPDAAVTAFTSQPDENGALGPNKNGYIHARHQEPMLYLVNQAVRNEDEDALALFVNNLNYAFAKQTAEGDFEFTIAPGAPTDRDPPAGRLAHDTVIFGYAVGMSMLILEQSEWYTQLADSHPSKAAINGYKDEMALVLSFITENIGLLQQADGMSPSRTLYDILAIYSLSNILKNQEAALLALPMLEQVFSAQNTNQGFYVEAQGWDSSFNGVSVALGLELYSLLTGEQHVELRERLGASVSCAANWQTTRILESGEISTEGNSLVRPGGLTIGGKEKPMDVEKTVRALAYMAEMTGDETYTEWLSSVLNYYE